MFFPWKSFLKELPWCWGMEGKGCNQSKAFWTRAAWGIKRVVMGREKWKGMWATDFKTHWELTVQQTLVALSSASQEVEAFLASNHVSLSPVQVYPSQKNNYPLLHTHYVLCVLNMLLPVHVIILRSRKCHGADFAEEETQTQIIKGLSRMPETVICYSWNLVSGCPRSAILSEEREK